MSILVNDSIQNNSPKPVDNKYAKFVSGATVPYASVSEANTLILSAYRSVGLTVLIDDGSGNNVEYWYKEGILDGDLVIKTTFTSSQGNLFSSPGVSTIAEFGASLDTGGTLIKVPAATTVDNVFVIQDSTGQKWKRIIDGPYRAVWAGAFGSGDKTAALQAVFNHVDVHTVLVDKDFDLNGTLTIPSGKILEFGILGFIKGTGTITGSGFYKAGQRTKCFQNTITVNTILPVDNIVTPFHFNAVADGTTNDATSIQKMFTYVETFVNAASSRLPIIKFPAGEYKVDSTVNLPFSTVAQTKWLEIEGYGAKLIAADNVTIFNRNPVNSTQSDACISGYIGIIKGLIFQGQVGGGTQKGMVLGSMYSWVIEDCEFSDLYDCLQMNFALNCTLKNIRIFRQRNTGIIGRYGTFSGATLTNSSFNANKIEKCRVYNGNGSFTSLQLIAADQTVVREFISEGFNPQYNFHIDEAGSTGVNVNTFEDIWLESVGGTFTQCTNFYLKVRNQTYLRKIQRISPNRLFEYIPVSGSHLIIDGLPFITNIPSSGLTFFSSTSSSGVSVSFRNCPIGTGAIVNDTLNWNGGVIPLTTTIEGEVITANGGYKTYAGTSLIYESASNIALYPGTSNRGVSINRNGVPAGSLFALSAAKDQTIATALTTTLGASIFFSNAAIRSALVTSNSTPTNAASFVVTKSRGTTDSPTAVVSGDVLGKFDTDAYDGTTRLNTSSIRTIADAAVSTGIIPTRVVIQTTNSSGTLADAFRVKSTGALEIPITPSTSTSGHFMLMRNNSTGEITQSLAGVESVDKFNLTTTGSRVVALGETLYEVHLKPTVDMTIDIGTSVSGSEIQDNVVLIANTTEIVTYKRTADSSFTVHFTGVSGGTLDIILVKKIY